ncbi:Uncharacterized membrane protein [Algoriphagus hitonicola]|uniref:Uncharacterized membrane protein n=1 Tax=Algoriphagus hitonicola TaxID=435880 RepID=A0A1I2RA81_9BACT|nr:Uncharacterized membrane protein [Algoriphagus hitonicola]
MIFRKKIYIAGFYLLSFFYIAAGINHFVSPEFYLPLIPDYLPMPRTLNAWAGVFEILLGIGLLYPSYRERAIRGIVILLLIFIPSHIYFIQIGSCVDGGLCLSPWMAWVRLVVIHPLLIAWALIYRNQKSFSIQTVINTNKK